MPESEYSIEELAKSIARQEALVSRSHRRFMNERMSELGLRCPLQRILLDLDRYPGANQDFIAQTLPLDKSGVARAAEELEELGYIRREIDPENRRKYKMALTEAGAALLPAIRARYREWERHLLEGFSPGEAQTLLTLLERMERNIENIE